MQSIYRITNIINNKVYIGKTNNCKKRWAKHIKKSIKGKNKLSCAIRKYGVANFLFEEILCVLSDDKEEINYFEKLLIAEHKSNQHEFGYNMTSGGDGGYIQGSEFYTKWGMNRKGNTTEFN